MRGATVAALALLVACGSGTRPAPATAIRTAPTAAAHLPGATGTIVVGTRVLVEGPEAIGAYGRIELPGFDASSLIPLLPFENGALGFYAKDGGRAEFGLLAGLIPGEAGFDIDVLSEIARRTGTTLDLSSAKAETRDGGAYACRGAFCQWRDEDLAGLAFALVPGADTLEFAALARESF